METTELMMLAMLLSNFPPPYSFDVMWEINSVHQINVTVYVDESSIDMVLVCMVVVHIVVVLMLVLCMVVTQRNCYYPKELLPKNDPNILYGEKFWVC